MKKKLTCIAVMRTGHVIKETIKVDMKNTKLKNEIYAITAAALQFTDRPKGERGAFLFGSTNIDLNEVIALQFKE